MGVPPHPYTPLSQHYNGKFFSSLPLSFSRTHVCIGGTGGTGGTVVGKRLEGLEFWCTPWAYPPSRVSYDKLRGGPARPPASHDASARPRRAELGRSAYGAVNAFRPFGRSPLRAFLTCSRLLGIPVHATKGARVPAYFFIDGGYLR